jgi:hypothetical protein
MVDTWRALFLSARWNLSIDGGMYPTDEDAMRAVTVSKAFLEDLEKPLWPDGAD